LRCFNLNLLSSYTQYRYSATVCVDILHFSRSCGRHAEGCAWRVTICTYFLLIIICHFHLVLLAWWVSTSSHTLLLLKRHDHQNAVIENIIKCKSLSFSCDASLYGLLDTFTGVRMHGRHFDTNQQKPNVTQKSNLM